MSVERNGLYEFGPYRLDAAKRLLTRESETVALAPKCFDLLLLLVASGGRVLKKQELMDALWPDTFVDEANLPFQIAALRKALGNRGAEWIEAVPRHGYRFTAPVTALGEAHVQPNKTPSSGPDPSSRHQALRGLIPWLIAGVTSTGCVLLAMVAILHFREAKPGERPVRFIVPLPGGVTLRDFDMPGISPDGQRLAFAGVGADAVPHLWARQLALLTSDLLPGTEGANYPFWSPDSRSIGFFADGKLKKFDLPSGRPQTICAAPGFGGIAGAWSRAGIILFRSVGQGPVLYYVDANGGEVKPATALNASRQEEVHRFPQFLPDGRHFIYLSVSAQPDNTGVYAGLLDSKESQRLIAANSYGAYAPSPSGPGHLLFMRGTALLAESFDPKRLRLGDDPLPIAENVWRTSVPPAYAVGFTVSENGALAYRTGSSMTQLVWLDRQGKRLGVVGGPGEYSNAALSPDEKKIVVGRVNPQIGARDLWIFDLEHGNDSRFTFDPADELDPIWSPDGSRIAFILRHKGSGDIYQKTVSGNSEAEPLLQSADSKRLFDWSPDGRVILFISKDALWTLPLQGDRKPRSLFRPADRPKVSPNGRWVTYTSSESGRPEVYVQNFPPSGGKWQVTTAGGEEPRWRRDGKELFYVANNRLLMSVAVKTDGRVFQSGVPQALFEAPLQQLTITTRYQVAANGQRFLVILPVEDSSSSPITVVLNWEAELKR